VSRWHYVIDGMVKKGWLTEQRASALRYPTVSAYKAGTVTSGCTGPTGFICQAVKADLARHGFSEQRLSAGGYRVYTTIDRKAQQAAVAAMAAHNGGYQTGGVDKGREAALVTMQPGDGAIRAMYGGNRFCGEAKHADVCTDLTGVSSNYARPPGSSFKPYTVIAALKEGISLDSQFSGPPSIQIGSATINNSEGESCGRCSLTEALAKSINTIFVPLAQKVGPDKIATAAHDAGIPKNIKLDEVPVITLGVNDVSPLDQARAYATVAAQGIEATPYLVASVRTPDNKVVYRAKKDTHRAFDADVMADTTYAMTKVLDCGSGGTACGKALAGRPAAGKTGTNGERSGNKDAWFIGFTPQLSTAVWYGNVARQKPVTTNGAPLYGGDLPAATWQQMMDAALQGQPVKSFPPPAHVGTAQGTTPSTTPTSGSPTPSTTPSSVTPKPTLTGAPSPVPTGPVPPVTPSDSPSASPSSGGGGGGGASPGATPGGAQRSPPG
jgi:membrane peptidoglycan carboxypeptidase